MVLRQVVELELEVVVVAAFSLVPAVCFPGSSHLLVVEVRVEVEQVVQVRQVVLVAQGFPPPPCLPPVPLCLLPTVRRVPLRSRRPSNFQVAAVEVVVGVQVQVVVR